MYNACHATKATNVVATYETKHDIVDNDMV
jgi:hypothetical protein